MEYLEAEEVIPGMIGQHYNNEDVTVHLIYQIKKLTRKDFVKLIHYDDSGWLPNSIEGFQEEDYREENFIDDDTWLVAVSDEHDSNAVYVYGGEGVIVPATERWKNSNKLSKTNSSTGILESFRRLKTFKDF